MFHIFFQTPADETEELLHQHGQTASALHAFLLIGHDCSMSPRGGKSGAHTRCPALRLVTDWNPMRTGDPSSLPAPVDQKKEGRLRNDLQQRPIFPPVVPRVDRQASPATNHELGQHVWEQNGSSHLGH